MADLHVLNTGSATSPFDTWAKAAATLAAATGGVAGDRYLVSNAHAETPATFSMALPGTPANPTKVLGGAPAAGSGLSSLAAGATITVSGTTFSLSGSAFIQNLRFIWSSGSSFSPAFGGTSGNVQKLVGCDFSMQGAGGSTTLSFGPVGAGAAGKIELSNCRFRFGGTGQVVDVCRDLSIFGGSVEAGGSTPSGLFNLGFGARPANLLVDGFDFSNFGTGFNVVKTVAEGSVSALLRNCKFPTGWAGGLVTAGQIKAGTRVEMVNYQIGTTLYQKWVEAYQGTIKSEATVKLSTDYCFKAVINANSAYPLDGLLIGEYYVKVTGGAAKTVTLATLTDNVTLTNADIALQVEYYAASGSLLGSFASSAPDALTTPSALATTADAWTTTGLATPVKQAVSVTFTPNQDGYIIVRPMLNKASTTVYVDNKLTVA